MSIWAKKALKPARHPLLVCHRGHNAHDISTDRMGEWHHLTAIFLLSSSLLPGSIKQSVRSMTTDCFGHNGRTGGKLSARGKTVEQSYRGTLALTWRQDNMDVPRHDTADTTTQPKTEKNLTRDPKMAPV